LDTKKLSNKPRLLIFVVAYHAERTIESVIRRIPADSLTCDYDVELLIIDDASKDHTFERSIHERHGSTHAFPIHILHNPVNQGYGGNQKVGFHYAIENRFDYVALVHGDGQYAPERLPELMGPFHDGKADAVFGSRMMTRGGALKGGMPLYKYVGNKILTWTQNYLLDSQLSEFHSGYRLYSIDALMRIPFDLNTNDFHFDTEIIIQLMIAQQRIVELPIPTYYGDEICYVNGMKYAWQVFTTTLRTVVQRRGILYDRKFDCAPKTAENAHYSLKLGYKSPHSLAINRIPSGARVLDIGCAGGYVGAELRKKGCKVTGMDVYPLADGITLDDFHRTDLNCCDLPDGSNFDYFIMLDVIEHLYSPETFMESLKKATRFNPDLKIILSTGNVAFFIQRLMLLLGQFNYGNRGILDKTHTRLFTYSSIRGLFSSAGFDLIEEDGIPAPFPLAIGDGAIAYLLLRVNNAFISVSRSLFAYQIFLIAKPRPSLEYLLRTAVETSNKKIEEIA
jgi:glycosyltransferase involved in cell wall biosynthesis